ncbi:MAG: KamA family radical SAM protein, partial [Planctomycetota bacterium]
MEGWQRLLADGVTDAAKLKEAFPHLDEKQMKAVTRQYPVRINKYYLGLIQAADDPVGRQVVPEVDEITDLSRGIEEDPLN